MSDLPRRIDILERGGGREEARCDRLWHERPSQLEVANKLVAEGHTRRRAER